MIVYVNQVDVRNLFISSVYKGLLILVSVVFYWWERYIIVKQSFYKIEFILYLVVIQLMCNNIKKIIIKIVYYKS